ncbi:hypothetical protein HDU90_007999 [Geranomyces variabilis]|nr:hypothetical protein HDU90_007999 [Geranomyces variabilis]
MFDGRACPQLFAVWTDPMEGAAVVRMPVIEYMTTGCAHAASMECWIGAGKFIAQSATGRIKDSTTGSAVCEDDAKLSSWVFAPWVDEGGDDHVVEWAIQVVQEWQRLLGGKEENEKLRDDLCFGHGLFCWAVQEEKREDEPATAAPAGPAVRRPNPNFRRRPGGRIQSGRGQQA